MIVIATGPSGQRTVENAREALQRGERALDAVQIGLMAAEADPTLTDIGYGGMPDASGRLSLDACLMDGAAHRAGAVAGLYGCRHPIAVARRVMERTPHVFLVGQGARDFATAEGFPDEGPLLTPHAQARFEAFRRGELSPEDTGERAPDGAGTFRDFGHSHHTDTVGCVALGPDGNLAGGCSTSGLSFKLPGRVGDSPILGAGLYVENDAGAATCLGMGEQMMQICLAFRVVAAMERGLSPTDACVEGMRALHRKRPDRVKHCLTIALSRSGATGAAASSPHPDLHFWQGDRDGIHRVAAVIVER